MKTRSGSVKGLSVRMVCVLRASARSWSSRRRPGGGSRRPRHSRSRKIRREMRRGHRTACSSPGRRAPGRFCSSRIELHSRRVHPLHEAGPEPIDFRRRDRILRRGLVERLRSASDGEWRSSQLQVAHEPRWRSVNGAESQVAIGCHQLSDPKANPPSRLARAWGLPVGCLRSSFQNEAILKPWLALRSAATGGGEGSALGAQRRGDTGGHPCKCCTRIRYEAWLGRGVGVTGWSKVLVLAAHMAAESRSHIRGNRRVSSIETDHLRIAICNESSSTTFMSYDGQ